MTPKKILVVEDEAVVATDIQNMLKDLGYDASVIALSGEDAIAKTEEIQPDLVLMDIVLKGAMNGIGAAEQIRAHFDIPVVFLTAYADEETLQRAKLTQPYGYIIKPFEERDLHTTIAIALYKHEMEQKLHESEEKYRSIFETAANLIVSVDNEGIIVDCNPRIQQVLGYAPDEIIGQSTTNIIHPEYLAKAQECLKEIVTLGFSYNKEYKMVRKDGTLIDVSINSGALKDEKGKFIRTICLIDDISERKQAEKRISRLSSVVEAMIDGVAITDLDGRITYVNNALVQLLGYERKDMIGKIPAELMTEKDRPKFAAEAKKVLLEKPPSKSSEYTGKGKNGQEIPLSVNLSILDDFEGKPREIIAVCRDITTSKKAEEERERLLNELEAKNRELEHFTYTVSHDLRSPLVTIQGFTTMLRDDLKQNEGGKVESDLDYIENAATKMDRLLKNTLHLSRIGRAANPPEEVPFGELVQEALEQTVEQTKSSGVEVSVAEDFPTVHVDRMRIVEVLVNLIVNSINYRGEQPHPKIEIGYRVGGEETVFFVKDNGIGIDKSEHEKVFDLFYRVSKSGEGTGAGLAIVKRIIEVHGGLIWIESEKGKGCTVCFTLPVV